MPKETLLETVLLSTDDALFTSCRLRFSESGVGIALARDAASFREALRSAPAGAVILDAAHTGPILGLSTEDAVAKLARSLSSRVILVLAEPGVPPSMVVKLLELGAHDVVQKPLKPRILAEQLKALVRVFARSGKPQKKFTPAPGDLLAVDYPARRCFVRDGEGGRPREVRLTRAELQVVYLLLQKKGALAAYADFREALWPDADSARQITHILHQLVTNIRRKLAPAPVRIENLRAEGFRLVQG
ncbi:MAG: winged helix-turn-helix domain-containing protein [Elusimicrobiales bacterium]|nr:winged helix-turn-helix domain-containing protein [Elusimicrobiales bacterium]